jgi:hypothetical protein
MGIAGIAVAAGELASAIGVDGVGQGELATGDRLVEDASDFEGLELNEMAVVSVVSLRGEACDAGKRSESLVEDGEEFGGIYFRHLFA